MLIISEIVKKSLKKSSIPKHIYLNIYNALVIVDDTKDINLFDITAIQDQHHKHKYHYYRIKKSDYRGIFYFESDNTYLYAIGKRAAVYDIKRP